MGRMPVGAFGPSGKVFHARLVAEDTRNHAPPLLAKALPWSSPRFLTLRKNCSNYVE
jgi:hypothetical protein